MIRDLASRYPLDALMLDKIPQIQLEPQAFNGLFDPPLRAVGSFCFCDRCRAEAGKRGLDLDAVRARALEIARRSLGVPPHIVEAMAGHLTGDTDIPRLLIEEPLIRQMLEFRFQTAIAFVTEAGRILKALRPKAAFQAAFVPPVHVGHDMTAPRSWLAVQSYALYAQALDEIHCVVHRAPDVVWFETRHAVEAAAGATRVLAGLRLYGATRPEEVAAMADAALSAGAAGVHFLGYDVATDALLEALRAWSAAAGQRA
jgi:hypothetical protein